MDTARITISRSTDSHGIDLVMEDISQPDHKPMKLEIRGSLVDKAINKFLVFLSGGK